MNKVRVTHFMWCIPYYRVAIFRQLSNNNNMIFEVCAGDNPDIGDGKKIACMQSREECQDIRWRPIHSVRLKGPVFKNWEWQPEAIKIVLTEKPDAVVVHGIFCISNWLLRVICRMRGIPVIDWTQGLKKEQTGLRWFVAHLYYRLADAILFYGHFAREFFIKRGYKQERLFVIYNSLDHEKQKLLRESFTHDDILKCRRQFGVINPDDRLIFNSTRLEKGKNIELLIEAVAQLRKSGRSVFLVLIGDGLRKLFLEQLCEELDVSDRVRFYGACYKEEDLAVIISASDLCVVPGPVGLIAMHSLVYGTPILTCDNSGRKHGPEIEAVMKDQTGQFFREGDLHDLVLQMEQMLYPAPCKKQMSAACMKIIDHFYTPQYQEQVMIEALNSVLPKHKQLSLS